MSGLVGKGIRSYKKANVSDSNNPALGFRNFIMAFEVSVAVGADIAIELANDAMPLTPPAEMVANGFQAPNNIEIINAQLGTFRNNVTVTSNLNGILIDRVSYTLTDTTIAFDDGLNAGEIIVIKRGNEVTTGNRIVDARPLRASGTVDFSMIGSSPVIFEVGEGFRIAPSTTATGGIDNRQIGFVQVFADGVLQARNVGNEDESMLPATEQTGNYREVIVDGLGVLLDPQNGVTANAIEFNQFQPFSAEEGVIVISTNLIVDSPNSTGVIDQVGALGARVTGVETDVTANTSNIAANTAAIANVGGHTIEDNLGNDVTNRTNLQFIGLTVTDDATNDRTIVSTTDLVATPFQTNEITTTGNSTLTVPVGAIAARVRMAGAGGGGYEGGVKGNNGGQGLDGGSGGNAGWYDDRNFVIGANGFPAVGATLHLTVGTGGSPSTKTFSDGGPFSTSTDAGAGGFSRISSVSTSAAGNIFFCAGGNGNTSTGSGISQGSLGSTEINGEAVYGGNGAPNVRAQGGLGAHGASDPINSSGGNVRGGSGGGGAGWVDGTNATIIVTATVSTLAAFGGTGGNGGILIEWFNVSL